MKRTSKLALAALIAGSVLSLQALGAEQSTREQCKAQVSDAYQNVDDMKFVSQRQFRDGTRIQYAVSHVDPETGYDNVRLAVCWLGSENYMAESTVMDDSLVAEVEGRYGYDQNGPLVEFLAP